MDKKISCSFVVMLFPFILLAQSANTDCSEIRKGTFYFYPTSVPDKFVIIRGDSIQEEINILSGDTIFWKINWQNDCRFNVRFIRKSKFMPDEERDFYNEHTGICEILNVSKSYYTFRAGLDSIDSMHGSVDTVWLKAR